MSTIFRLKFQRREFNQSVMAKRMTNSKKKKKKACLILLSDGQLHWHCRKGCLSFQQTWRLQTHTTLQPFRLYRQSYLIPSLTFTVQQKLLHPYVRFMEPISVAWLRHLGKEFAFSAIVLKLSSVIASWLSSTFCVAHKNETNGPHETGFGQGKQLLKACHCSEKWIVITIINAFYDSSQTPVISSGGLCCGLQSVGSCSKVNRNSAPNKIEVTGSKILLSKDWKICTGSGLYETCYLMKSNEQ